MNFYCTDDFVMQKGICCGPFILVKFTLTPSHPISNLNYNFNIPDLRIYTFQSLFLDRSGKTCLTTQKEPFYTEWVTNKESALWKARWKNSLKKVHFIYSRIIDMNRNAKLCHTHIKWSWLIQIIQTFVHLK